MLSILYSPPGCKVIFLTLFFPAFLYKNNSAIRCICFFTAVELDRIFIIVLSWNWFCRSQGPLHFRFVGYTYLFKCIQEKRCHIILFRTFCAPMSLHILYVVAVFIYGAYTLANLVVGVFFCGREIYCLLQLPRLTYYTVS